jgi:putative addiction module component (TIGR02574 family)
MAPTTIRRAALALSAEERAALAAEMLASLDEGGDELASDSEWASAWGDELERRADEFDAGRVEAVSADEVFGDARRRRATRR